ncbi:alpha/beta fold hydrolase [Streptomyces californicus]|uniref:alpha/beta fold hydrolase n=1 Tax=Streptomyces TaxID=1883 RepID=UPI0004C0215F|nr:alpha/beta fold hydrolase [Streptomyces californicus]MCC0575714.1 alpha/beta hydrolase [Streptomyces californicus]QRV53416.1 alpha/beta fold hydrolase [Streptomyces californicus]
MELTTQGGFSTRVFGPRPRAGEPATVLVHGLGLSGRYFVPLARRLAERGATVLVPDLPGNGRSRAAAGRAPSPGDHAEALARWHLRLALGPVTLVANSVGCQVAAALAAEQPHTVSRLVLIGPALDPDVPAPHQVARLVRDVPREPPRLYGLAVRDYLVTGPARCAVEFHHALRDAAGPFTDRLAGVRAPTLVIRGAGDPLASPAWTRRLASLTGDGRTAEIAGAAHAAHYSAPDATATLIEKFAADSPGGLV